jgi:hypothetical protein
MADDVAKILSHVPNSGIVQMPGRKFPGIVMQGIRYRSCLVMLRTLSRTQRRGETKMRTLIYWNLRRHFKVSYSTTRKSCPRWVCLYRTGALSKTPWFETTSMPNSALLTDAFSLLRCACGAAKRGR